MVAPSIVRRPSAALWGLGLGLVCGGGCKGSAIGDAGEIVGRERHPYAERSTETGRYNAIAEAIEPAFAHFVVAPGAEAAGVAVPDRQDWDTNFINWLVHSVSWHHRSQLFWIRLEAVTQRYATVAGALEREDLPVVLAALPFMLTGYRDDATGPNCTASAWLLPLERANRAGLVIRACRIEGRDALWSVTRKSPPHRFSVPPPYRDPIGDRCKIMGCGIDQRKDASQADMAALTVLQESWNHPLISASGAAVELTALAAQMGLDDDGIDGEGLRESNATVLLRRWNRTTSHEIAIGLYGAQISCRKKEVVETNDVEHHCGRVLEPQTQHGIYSMVAQHILANCYYAKNHADIAPFGEWATHLDEGGYCRAFEIPTTADVAAWPPHPSAGGR